MTGRSRGCPGAAAPGLGRLAVEGHLHDRGCSDRLVAAGFAELQDDLATAVEATWQRRSARGHTVPYPRLVRDVWELLRGAVLLAFLSQLPANCMLLVFAGSPCQQLTRAGFFQGWQGLCGPESVHFFVIPWRPFC